MTPAVIDPEITRETPSDPCDVTSDIVTTVTSDCCDRRPIRAVTDGHKDNGSDLRFRRRQEVPVQALLPLPVDYADPKARPDQIRLAGLPVEDAKRSARLNGERETIPVVRRMSAQRDQAQGAHCRTSRAHDGALPSPPPHGKHDRRDAHAPSRLTSEPMPPLGAMGAHATRGRAADLPLSGARSVVVAARLCDHRVTSPPLTCGDGWATGLEVAPGSRLSVLS